MSANHPSDTFGAGHKKFPSEYGRMTLLLFAVVLFAVSIAVALAFTNARVHRSPAMLQGWHDARIVRLAETVLALRLPGSYATTRSPSSPTTSA
jgi:hypothetical protein